MTHYTLEPGRTICRDDLPVGHLALAHGVRPSDADAFAHVIVEALNMHVRAVASQDALGYAVGFACAYLDMAAKVTAKGTKAKLTVRQLNALMEQARHVLVLAEPSPDSITAETESGDFRRYDRVYGAENRRKAQD